MATVQPILVDLSYASDLQNSGQNMDPNWPLNNSNQTNTKFNTDYIIHVSG